MKAVLFGTSASIPCPKAAHPEEAATKATKFSRMIPLTQGARRFYTTFSYQNYLFGRLPVVSTQGLVVGTYKNHGLGSQW